MFYKGVSEGYPGIYFTFILFFIFYFIHYARKSITDWKLVLPTAVLWLMPGTKTIRVKPLTKRTEYMPLP